MAKFLENKLCSREIIKNKMEAKTVPRENI